MSFDLVQMVRVAKRMRQATGYLELGMGLQAREQVSTASARWVHSRPRPTCCAVPVSQRSIAMTTWSRRSRMLREVPLAARQGRWPPSECYRQVGDVERAVESLANAWAKPHSAGQKTE